MSKKFLINKYRIASTECVLAQQSKRIKKNKNVHTLCRYKINVIFCRVEKREIIPTRRTLLIDGIGSVPTRRSNAKQGR